MVYQIEFKPRAIRDLKALDKARSGRIMEKIRLMQDDLAGDVKHLSSTTPEFRLRMGDYRILFELEGGKVIIYRVLHRKDAYG